MDNTTKPFRDAHQDVAATTHLPDTAQANSPAYRLAFADADFLCRDELRPIRLQLELLKPQMEMDERGIESTVVLFGGARIPCPDQAQTARTPQLAEMCIYYDEARKFAHAITKRSIASNCKTDVVVTGGGPGVMEAGNEQEPNHYITPELCFNFHYFAIRKMHFLIRAKAVAVFPGGFGTLDELFETLTLIQTGRMKPVPVILFGEKFWRDIVNWDALSAAGTIGEDDLNLFRFVETAEQALQVIDTWPNTGGPNTGAPNTGAPNTA